MCENELLHCYAAKAAFQRARHRHNSCLLMYYYALVVVLPREAEEDAQLQSLVALQNPHLKRQSICGAADREASRNVGTQEWPWVLHAASTAAGTVVVGSLAVMMVVRPCLGRDF